jgi:signal transduction histidine kinase
MAPLQPASRSTLAPLSGDPVRAALARAVFRDRGSGDWTVIGVGGVAAMGAANAAPVHGSAPAAAAPVAAAPRQPLAATAKPASSAAPAATANPPVEQTARTIPVARPAPTVASAASHADWVLPPPVAHGPFGSAPTGLVQADFVAALQVAPDRWVTVQPAPEPFPNRWQRRLLLWFALSFAIVAPIGYLFARRLVAPIATFSAAAERLGRDPSGPLLALEGPAEIGRAAGAFNLMQQRLKRYIDDRTAMVGAISHDLRTPLARIRFRVERVSPEVRAGILGDVTQMEEMISAVLIFIRDASEPGARERVDLRSIVECAVDDAALVGGDAVLDPGAPTSVEVDPLGVQRVVTNLIENALKYGKTARVRVFTEGDESITEVADTGPGLAEDELERVFLPFYRAAMARTLDKGGIGLGLAVSRSIARAHGGDVRLYKNGGEGLVAQLRLPLADEV